MRLDQLIQDSKNLRATLDGYEQLGDRHRQDDIHVHAYVVRAHWRKRPKRPHSLRLVANVLKPRLVK